MRNNLSFFFMHLKKHWNWSWIKDYSSDKRYMLFYCGFKKSVQPILHTISQFLGKIVLIDQSQSFFIWTIQWWVPRWFMSSIFKVKVSHHKSVIVHFKDWKWKKNQFQRIFNFCCDVKGRAAGTENFFRWTSFEIWCKTTVELKKIASTMCFPCEYSTNMANIFKWITY